MEKELDSFLVELNVLAIQDLSNEPEVYMNGHLLININMEKPYGESDIVLANNFLESMNKDGEHHIFSCCCGMPDCSGWEKPFQISTQDDIVKWVDPNNDKIWCFDKSIMTEQIKTIQEDVQIFKAYFKKKEIDYVGVGYSW